MSIKQTTWGARLGISLLSLLILFASYYGLYRHSLGEILGIAPEVSYCLPRVLGGPFPSPLIYHCVEFFFRPAHELDRIVRPRVWNGYADEYDIVGREGRNR